jgi:hypothetical protein
VLAVCPSIALWGFCFLPAVYQKAYAVSNQPGDDGPADVGESRRDGFRENSKIQKDDRDLRGNDDYLVDVLIKVEILPSRCQKLLSEGLGHIRRTLNIIVMSSNGTVQISRPNPTRVTRSGKSAQRPEQSTNGQRTN